MIHVKQFLQKADLYQQGEMKVLVYRGHFCQLLSIFRGILVGLLNYSSYSTATTRTELQAFIDLVNQLALGVNAIADLWHHFDHYLVPKTNSYGQLSMNKQS